MTLDKTLVENARQLAIPSERDAKVALAMVEDFQITDQASYDKLGGFVKLVKAQWKAVDEQRKGLVGPLLNTQRAINAMHAPALDLLGKAEQLAKQKIGAYVLATQQAREVAMVEQIPHLAPAVPETKGVSVRTVLRFEITDPDEVPRQFCSPDPEKIRAHLEDGGLAAIKGVRFFEDTSVTVRQDRK